MILRNVFKACVFQKTCIDNEDVDAPLFRSNMLEDTLKIGFVAGVRQNQANATPLS